MRTDLIAIAGLALVGATATHGAEPGASPVPAAVRALGGCWAGEGSVMGKPVTISLTGTSAALGAMFVIETESRAKADRKDRYAAHLVFGGGERKADAGADAVTGYWADSFGGTFTATGTGSAGRGEFEISCRYPDDIFANRWNIAANRATWSILARHGDAAPQTFASYLLFRRPCRAGTQAERKL